LQRFHAIGRIDLLHVNQPQSHSGRQAVAVFITWPADFHLAISEIHHSGALGVSCRILPGQWDGFEAAYKKASAMWGAVKGLKSQWLVRDQNDRDAGYSISLWDSDEDMRVFWDSPKQAEAMAIIQPFFANQ
jgi:hypothetical protein